jgi:predicted peptidase
VNEYIEKRINFDWTKYNWNPKDKTNQTMNRCLNLNKMKNIPSNKFTKLLFTTFMLVILSCQDSPAGDDDKSQKMDKSQYAVTGGYHQPHPLETTASPYGYWFFTPEGQDGSEEKIPLLIFLHGYGERGNSKTDPSALAKILFHGPPKLINSGNWTMKNKMYVASAQCHGDWWNRDMLKQFIEYLMESNDKIDTSRIYLTGLSMGGYATFDLLGTFGEGAHIAAAVPICGSGVLSEEGNSKLSKIPLWVFHGDADQTVTPEYSKAIVPAINQLNPEVKAKLTVYPGVGHDSWTMTYDGTGMGKEDPTFDPFDKDIYSWMNQYKKK